MAFLFSLVELKVKLDKQWLEENIIDVVIGLPAGLFQTTGIPVAILIIDRSREKRWSK